MHAVQVRVLVKVCSSPNVDGKHQAQSVASTITTLCDHYRISDDYISTVALCAGAGTSILKGMSADLYLTGEMLHHDILDAVHGGSHVILTNHSDSERGFLKTLAAMLDRNLQKAVKVCVSEADRDPLQTV